MQRRLSVGIALLFLGSAAWAGEGGRPAELAAASGPVEALKVGADCSGGWQRDDGSFEGGFSFLDAHTAMMAMSFDVPAPTRIDAVCLCLFLPDNPANTTFQGTIDIWSADADGVPLASLKQVPATFANVSTVSTFYRIDIPGGVRTQGPKVAIGLTWSPAQAPSVLYLCNDQNGPGGGRASYRLSNAPSGDLWLNLETLTSHYRALGVRADVTPIPPDPAPPAGPWLSAPTLPGFEFKVRVNGSAPGTQVADCVPETLCVAGAIPTRTELFLRVIGPRPNGFRWVEGVRFTTSRLEIWARERASAPEQGPIRYYDFPAVPADSDELPGLVDKTAF
jgi:hypothetical protein